MDDEPDSRASRALLMKTRQVQKIRELAGALRAHGYYGLDAQAAALRLSRSTAWHLLSGRHKNSGISFVIIERMLRSPELPSGARTIILEYVEERAAGHYGGTKYSLRKFRDKIGSWLDLGDAPARGKPRDRVAAASSTAFPVAALGITKCGHKQDTTTPPPDVSAPGA